MNTPDHPPTRNDPVWRAARVMVAFVAVLWLVEIVDWLFFGGALDRLGIAPRQLVGLRGIVLAPLLHGSFAHLVANTVPLAVLGFLVLLRNPQRFLAITAVVALFSGLGTWLIGPANTIHIGASGIVFGYFAYLVVAAYYERSWAAVVVAAFLVFIYGGILWGALPSDGPVSWQGHLFGLVGGVVAARLFAPRAITIRIFDV